MFILLMKEIIRKVMGFFLIILLLVILQVLISIKAKIDINITQMKAGNTIDKEGFLLGFLGETITYDVKLGMVNLGKARFQHLAKTELDGRDVNLMTFQTQMLRFNDLEKIYSDAKSFLPLKVERDIRIWSAQEKITEDYDQKNFIVTITKFKGKEKEEISIQKDGVIHNAILLPYYVRRIPKLDVGWTVMARLPTQQFLIRLVSVEYVTVPAGIFKSYRFRSTPKKFEIWISADERRIPVKLTGCGYLGYTLVMKDYNL